MTEPQMLGKYQILEEIGRGGFATVYRAFDTILEREVALKVLKPGWTDDAKAVERFMREARAASRLDQPGIITIYDVGSADGRLFIAMKLLAGQSLDQLIKANGALSWERTLNIVQQVAEALDYAHGKGLVHRDIKPSNIIVSEGDRAVLTDFGLVRGAEQASLSTGSTGGILGTPEYIPPEVWEGQPATKASDIYALACVVYEMLLGRPLFEADTGAAVMRKHVLVGAEFPANWPPGVPGDVAVILRKALEREQNQRYSTAGEFAVALRECASQAANAQQAAEQEARRKQLEAEEIARKAREEQEQEAARVAAESTALEARHKQEEAERKAREKQEQEATPVAVETVALEVRDQQNSKQPRLETTPLIDDKSVVAKTWPASSRPTWLIPISGLILLVAAVVVIANLQRPAAVISVISPTAASTSVMPTDVPAAAPVPTLTPMPTEPFTSVPTAKRNGKILFESNRDGNFQLYVMNADGSNVAQLTSGPGLNWWGNWSPDGKKIAFQSTRDGNSEIYVMNADGANQTRLTNNPADDYFSPAWSADGTQIAFVSRRDGKDNIYLMNADGSNLMKLPGSADIDNNPAFSPDGSKLSFESSRTGKYQIYISDGAREPVRLTDCPIGCYGSQWSPDGKEIVLLSKLDASDTYEIFKMNVDGTGLTRLVGANSWMPSWSPDGEKIIFNSVRDGTLEIYTMNKDGSAQTPLTNTSTEGVDPKWQPIGSDVPIDVSTETPSGTAGGRIIFPITVNSNQSEWHIMNSDGSGIAQYDSSNLNVPRPDISPDGKKKVYWSGPDSAAFQIYMSNIDGSGEQRLTNNSSSDSVASWSPDGNYIYFNSTRDGHAEIYRMSPDGSNQERLTQGQTNNYLFGTISISVWSPNSNRILFVSERNGNAEVYAMNPDGSEQTQLTHDKAYDTCPVWSPDGKRIAFISNRNGGKDVYAYDVYSMEANGAGVTQLTHSGNIYINIGLSWVP